MTYIINSPFLTATKIFFSRTPEYISKLKSPLFLKIYYPSLFIFVTAGSGFSYLQSQTALHLITQVADKETEQSCPLYQSLRGVTLAAGLWTADQYSLSPAMNSNFPPTLFLQSF